MNSCRAKDAKNAELDQACIAAINSVYTDTNVTDFTTAIQNYRQTLASKRQEVANATTVDAVNAISWDS